MSNRDAQRLAEISAAIAAIRSHIERGPLTDGLVFDAVRIRLLEIGEAVKGLSIELLDHEPTIPWSEIARMRDHLAHRYFDTNHAIVQATVDNDIAELDAAIARLRKVTKGPVRSTLTSDHRDRNSQDRANAPVGQGANLEPRIVWRAGQGRLRR